MVVPAKQYLGHWTDSRRWAAFELRASDIILSTPPKSGTTWAQNILLMMALNTTTLPDTLENLSPWLDSQTREMRTVTKAYARQTHRRCIKTHTPFDGLPYRSDITYIAVYRHPLDVYFSMRNHIKNMHENPLHDMFPDDARAGALKFIHDTPPKQDCDYMTLETLVNHYKTFKSRVHLQNVHLFHYADMHADLHDAIRKFASILKYDFSKPQLHAFVQAASFETMRQNAKQFTPASGLNIFKNDADFFHSAQNKKWERSLEQSDLKAYANRLCHLLVDDCQRWLNMGNAAPPHR